MNRKCVEDFKELLEEQIKKVVKKDTISSEDLNLVSMAASTVESLMCIYGDEETGASEGSFMRHPKYAYDDMAEHSFGRGRSPVTGRYISNGYDAWSNGYSGHSIEDRMVAKLEEMYDEAKTNHEKEMVSTWIEKIKMNK
jgi:hypothetical protein